MRILLSILLLEVFLWAQGLPVKPSGKLYLGFLDDAREEMANWKPGIASQRVVRPAFERTAAGWKQVDLSSLPPRMTWTIAFDGRNLGQVESQADPNGGLTPFQTILTSAAAVPERWVSVHALCGGLDEPCNEISSSPGNNLEALLSRPRRLEANEARRWDCGVSPQSIPP